MIFIKTCLAGLCAGLFAFTVGCGGSASSEVAPTISTQPANQAISEGSAATFSVVAAGTTPLTYQWSKGGVAIADATSASHTTPPTTPADTGATFTVTVSNRKGSVTSAAATLTVNANTPTITTQPSAQTVTAGSAATFTVVAAGSAPLAYQWRKDGAAITGATAATYTITSAILVDAGTYTVRVSNAAGNVVSTGAVLTVNAPPAITTQPASQTVLVGSAVSFTVAATGSPAPSYQWKKDGAAIAGATSATFTIASASLADAGSYTVVVTNSQSNVTSNAATLTVQAPPAITTQPSDLAVLVGASANFTVVASGTPAPGYQWKKNGVAIAGATAATYTITSAILADAGTYTVLVSNAAGNVTSNGAVLTVNAPPAITTQPASQTVLVGSAVSFTVAATGAPAPSYQWKKDGAAIAGATSATFTIASASLSDAGSYTVVVTNSQTNVTSNAATLTVQAPPAITTQPSSLTVDAPASASFTVAASGTPAPSYQWRKGGVAIGGATAATFTIASTTLASAGTYTAYVSNVAGNVTSSGAVLTVNAAPTITTQPQNQSVVAGQTASFSVSATGFPVPTYQWQKNTVDIGGATASSYTTPATVLGDSGAAFRVVVTNSKGSVTSGAATLTVTVNHAISGTVFQPGGGAPNVVITIDTTPSRSATTDGSGQYSIGNLPNGTYNLTPSIVGPSAIFSPVSRSVQVTGTDVSAINFQASLGFTVSGTVNYAGSKTGRIYLSLGGGCCGAQYGTSIAGPSGAFSIRGVAPGTYTLNAGLDFIGFGNRNASDPAGTTTGIAVTTSNVTGADVTLADPTVSLAGMAGPNGFSVSPLNGAVFLSWNSIQASNGGEADSYLVEYSVDNTFPVGVTTTSFSVPGDGRGVMFRGGLADGAVLYFRISGVVGVTQSNPSAVVGPITIGSRPGGHSFSGTVTFPGAATGPLNVGLFNQSTQAVYGFRIAAPVSPQSFTVTGVPDGAYFFFAALDNNNNGLFDAGDLTNTNGNAASTVTISGSDLSGQPLTLTATNLGSSLSTGHFQSNGINDNYSLHFEFSGAKKRPVAIALVSGPNTISPLDVPINFGQFQLNSFLGSVRPIVGDLYAFSVTYSDATTETVNLSVSTVLDSFPRTLGTTGTTTPTFTWVAPSTPPSSYSYFFRISESTGAQVWQYPGNNNNGQGIPSSTTSLLYNLDGRASQASLTPGTQYNWSLSVQDSFGNQAEQQVSYTPP